MLKEYIQGVRSLSIIGMCKNAGKTTVLNKLIAELNESRVRLGLTRIGRDGESTDLVTRTAKPGIYVYEGTLVATAVDMFRLSDITREIIYSTGWPTPMGEVAVVRARSDGNVQLAGPSMTAQLSALVDVFSSFGADMTIIDGALSRKTLCAPTVSEATILCTGASYSRDINVVIEDTAFSTALLTLPRQESFSEAELDMPISGKIRFKRADGTVEPMKDGLTLAEALRSREYADVKSAYITGAVTDATIKPVLMGGAKLKGFELSAEDGSKLLLSYDSYEKLLIRGVRIGVRRPVKLAAITVNPRFRIRVPHGPEAAARQHARRCKRAGSERGKQGRGLIKGDYYKWQ